MMRLLFWHLKRSFFHHNSHIRLCERYQLKSMLRLKPNKKETEAMRKQIESTFVKYQ
jgi:hypothetical protein